MNSARSFVQITRKLSQKAAPSPTFAALKQTQKRFQIDDGVPVHIKSGATDKVLFAITAVLTAVGLAMSGEVLYSLAVPKKE